MMCSNPEFGALLWTSWSGCGALASKSMRRFSARMTIDEKVLPNLTAEDLKDLGVASLGHRRELLDAIAALRTEAKAERPLQTLRQRRAPRALKTAPNAAKSR